TNRPGVFTTLRPPRLEKLKPHCGLSATRSNCTYAVAARIRASDSGPDTTRTVAAADLLQPIRFARVGQRTADRRRAALDGPIPVNGDRPGACDSSAPTRDFQCAQRPPPGARVRRSPEGLTGAQPSRHHMRAQAIPALRSIGQPWTRRPRLRAR